MIVWAVFFLGLAGVVWFFYKMVEWFAPPDQYPTPVIDPRHPVYYQRRTVEEDVIAHLERKRNDVLYGDDIDDLLDVEPQLNDLDDGEGPYDWREEGDFGEQSTITSGLVMVDRCPGCDNQVGGGNKVARAKAEDVWWHQRCWDRRDR